MAMLHLDEVTYAGDGPGVAAGTEAGKSDGKARAGPSLHKAISFSGLTLDLQSLTSAPESAEAADVAAPVLAESVTAAAEQCGGEAAGGSEAAPDSGWSMRVSTSSLEEAAGSAPPPSAHACDAGSVGGSGHHSRSASSSCQTIGSSNSSAASLAASAEAQQQDGAGAAVICGEGGAGLSGLLALRLTWPEAGSGGSGGPRAVAQLSLAPLRCQLRQRHLPLLSDAAAALATALARRPDPPQPVRC